MDKDDCRPVLYYKAISLPDDVGKSDLLCAPQIHSLEHMPRQVEKASTHLICCWEAFAPCPARQHTELEKATKPLPQMPMTSRASRFEDQKLLGKNCAAQGKTKIAKCCQQTGKGTKNTPAEYHLQIEKVSNSDSHEHTRICVNTYMTHASKVKQSSHQLKTSKNILFVWYS